jgi:hypothetical protein
VRNYEWWFQNGWPRLQTLASTRGVRLDRETMWLNVDTTAALANVPSATIYYHIELGALTVHRLSQRRIRIAVEDAAVYLGLFSSSEMGSAP